MSSINQIQTNHTKPSSEAQTLVNSEAPASRRSFSNISIPNLIFYRQIHSSPSDRAKIQKQLCALNAALIDYSAKFFWKKYEDLSPQELAGVRETALKNMHLYLK